MMRWYFYHRQEIGYVYGSTKSYKVFLLGAMFSQKFHDFVVSSVSSNLQRGLAVSALRLYISTVFEQQAHNLRRHITRGRVQRGEADLILHIYNCTMSSSNRWTEPSLKLGPLDAQSNGISHFSSLELM